jgi:flap endonuclease-1
MIFLCFKKIKIKMGIKNLTSYLRKNYPDIFETIHISEYKHQKIAVDTSLYVCNFKALYGEGWLRTMLVFIGNLRYHGVHPVFIFDTGYPPEKQKERDERRENRAKTDERIARLEDAIEKYKSEGVVDDILREFQERRKLVIKGERGINLPLIVSTIDKMKKQLFIVGPEDFQKLKVLLKILGVPFYDAPLEGETMCADLCKRGIVSAVLTEDSDVLVVGTKVFLSKLNTKDYTCERVVLEKLMEVLEMTDEEFLHLGIMFGTDFNPNIPNIGPVKAMSLIKKYKNIDNIGSVMDISMLNHERVVDIFRNYEKSKENIEYCGSVDFQGLAEYIFKHNLNIEVEYLKRYFIQEVVFEEEEGNGEECEQEDEEILEEEEN